jgi:hypothetical protein
LIVSRAPVCALLLDWLVSTTNPFRLSAAAAIFCRVSSGEEVSSLMSALRMIFLSVVSGWF